MQIVGPVITRATKVSIHRYQKLSEYQLNVYEIEHEEYPKFLANPWIPLLGTVQRHSRQVSHLDLIYE